MFLFDESKRFQECSYLERLWRSRYYLQVPYYSIKLWLRFKLSGTNDCFYIAWGIEAGTAEGRMKYYYTLDEILLSIDLRDGSKNCPALRKEIDDFLPSFVKKLGELLTYVFDADEYDSKKNI